MKRLIFLSITILFTSSCDSDGKICDFTEVIQMQFYDRTFQNNLAGDVDHICGNDEKGMPAEYQYACRFIQDSLELRAKINALQEN